MLILDYNAEDILGRYSEFISTVTWFRMLCAGCMGYNKAEYLDGFEVLKEKYESLYEHGEDKGKEGVLRSNVHFQYFQHAIDKIEEILSSARIADIQLTEICNILWDFQSEHEEDFSKSFFEKERRYFSTGNYSTELCNVVENLLDNGENDQAILTSFKLLDSHLQNLLSVQSHELHGEELINRAFAPSSGILQMGRHPNEQVGLRNFFSGANAVFRNPSAHRFTNYDNFTSETLVAMVAIMAQMASELANKKKANE